MRTRSTTEIYRKEGLRLLRRHRMETGHENLEGFVDWLIRRKEGIRKNTWYTYKQAGLQILDELGRSDDKHRLESEGSDGCRAGREKIRRGLSDREIDRLWNKAKDSPSRIRAWLWVVAGRATGLRPSEWEHAELTDGPGGPVLVVRNAKHTNGRGNGETRRIDLSDIVHLATYTDSPHPNQAWEAIKSHLANVVREKEKPDGFRRYKKACRNALYRLTKEAGVGGANLYAARHQFAADAKRANLSQSEVAALMGHSSAETATTHYGRRIQGRGEPVPMPDPREVATVRKAMRSSHEKKAEI
ncbi:site-specific integrase [Leptospirillum ferriphilum]|uniref:site-specific integrase n=1 Tax=Leptospirillum ferriphilum TaxID=178606 RepID=UPI0006B1B2A4|nr:site-specific integrase [Leptospirillum ferriphilum]